MKQDSESAPCEASPAEEGGAGAPAVDTPAEGAQDSAAFMRCCACRYAAEVDRSAGTLLCVKHNMLCEAESGAIPDDCVEHEPGPDGNAES